MLISRRCFARMRCPRRIKAFCLSVLIQLPGISVAKTTHTTPVDGVYLGAITIDAATGAVLFEDNADGQNPPASMTKLMTFAVVREKLAAGSLTFETPVRITAEDARMGGTQVYLDPRETFSVGELLHAMMIQSANDASYALARASAGSVPAFVEMMNAKARELGMTQTIFRSPHGLPPASRRMADGDLTSPRDFARLCRHLIQNTDVLTYTSIREREFGPNRAGGPMKMRNHNNLLGKIPGVDGLKTGYTHSAGYCLSATAERNSRRIIVVIMGSFGPGRQIDRGRARDLKTIELLDQGFATLPPATVPLVKGTALSAPAPRATDIPTVKTNKSDEQSSTPPPTAFKFHITPLEK